MEISVTEIRLIKKNAVLLNQQIANPNYVIGKRMVLYFYNKYTGEYLGSQDSLYNREKMMKGKYRKFWLNMKSFLANEYHIDKHWIRLKVFFY